MTLLQRLGADRLAARQNKDAVLSTLLTTVYSEAAMIGKNDGNRESRDDEVMKVIKKFIKNNEDFIGAMLENGNGKLTTKQVAIEKTLRNENHVLMSYLPTQLSMDELSDIVITFLKEHPEAEKKDVFQFLKHNYDGLYNGKDASNIVKNEID